MYIETICCGARCATIAHFCQHCTVDCSVDVGVAKYQERSIAAKLHAAVNYSGCCLRKQDRTNLCRTRKTQLANFAAVHHCGNRGARRIGDNNVDHAGRNARALQNICDCQRRKRRILRRLQHHRAAGCKCWPNLASCHCGGKIPRGGQQRNAHWLARDHQPIGAAWSAAIVAINAHCFFAKPTEEFGRVGNFGTRVGKDLAHLECDQPSKLFLFGHHDLECFAQYFSAHTWRSVLPCVKCLVCRVYGAQTIGD